MKLWATKIFIFFYITTSTQFCQLYKLPVFISHFIEHDKGGDFLDEMKTFLVHHYGGHEVDADWETDQKLPFMKVEFVHIDFFFSPIKLFDILHLDKEISTTSIKIFDEDFLHTYYLDSIWQPPKQA